MKKRQNNSNLNFFKTFLTSLIIIFVFSILPNTVNFIKNNLKPNEVVINSSKQNFDKILEKQRKNNKEIEEKIKDRFSWNIFPHASNYSFGMTFTINICCIPMVNILFPCFYQHGP